MDANQARAQRLLQQYEPLVREIVKKGIDPSRPEHLVVARVCALWAASTVRDTRLHTERMR